MKEQIKGVGYDGKLWLLIDEVTQVSESRARGRIDGPDVAQPLDAQPEQKSACV